MKKSRFTDNQVIDALKRAEGKRGASLSPGRPKGHRRILEPLRGLIPFPHHS